jgi:hypothetical protein
MTRVLLAGFTAALVLAACGGEDAGGYSPEVEETFIEGCLANSGDGLTDAKAREFCQCAYDDVEATVPFEEFEEYDAKTREDPNTPLPPRINAVLERCVSKVIGS